MHEKTISTITRIGAVIVTTITSFVVLPPVLGPEENGSLNWKNIFTFIAGVLTIVLFDAFGAKSGGKRPTVLMLGMLVILFVSYEILYEQYSMSCYESIRVVTSPHAVKPEVADRLKNFPGPHALHDFLESNRCSALAVWNAKDVYIPYFGMIALYFSIIIVFVLLIVRTADVIQKKRQ